MQAQTVMRIAALFTCLGMLYAGPSHSQSPISSVAIFQDHLQRAEEAYLAKSYDDALELFQLAVVQEPTYGLAWFRIGLLHQQAGRLQPGWDAYSRVIAMSEGPTVTPELQEMAAKSRYNRAHIGLAMALEDFRSPMTLLEPRLKANAVNFSAEIERLQMGVARTLTAQKGKVEAEAQCLPEPAVPKANEPKSVVTQKPRGQAAPPSKTEQNPSIEMFRGGASKP